jgi:hypothetical protein
VAPVRDGRVMRRSRGLRPSARAREADAASCLEGGLTYRPGLVGRQHSRRCGGARGVEVVRSQRRDIDALRKAVADLLRELDATALLAS